MRDARTAVSGQLRVSLENRKDDARQRANQPVAEEVNPPRNLQPALTCDASSSRRDDYDIRSVTLMETIREAPGEVISGRLRVYVEPERPTRCGFRGLRD